MDVGAPTSAGRRPGNVRGGERPGWLEAWEPRGSAECARVSSVSHTARTLRAAALGSCGPPSRLWFCSVRTVGTGVGISCGTGSVTSDGTVCAQTLLSEHGGDQ